jgi:hypothetical protein
MMGVMFACSAHERSVTETGFGEGGHPLWAAVFLIINL